MDRAEIASLVGSLPSPRWRRAVLRSDGATEVRWLPVLDLLGQGLDVGLTDGGDWVLECVDGLVPLASEPALDSLLTCLFFPLGEVEAKLRVGVEALGLPVVVAESFPFMDLVAHALAFSPFYAELAQEWVGEGPGREVFLPLLRDLADADETRSGPPEENRANELAHPPRRGRAEQP